MRILILTDSFLSTQGGVARHTYTLACYLSEASNDVHVVTEQSQNPRVDMQLDRNLKRLYNIEVFRKWPRRKELPLLNRAGYILDCRNIAKYLNKRMNSYDIVHYHGTRQLLFRFVRGKTPIITSIHGIFPACIMQSPKQCQKRTVARCAICHLSQWPKLTISLPLMITYISCYYKLMEKSLKSANKVVCVSEYVREYIEKVFNLDNLVTLYNFIDYEREIRPQLTNPEDFDARNRMNVPSDAKIITYFGRLSYEKGVDVLIKAFKIIRKKVEGKIYLVIGGDGPQKMQLEEIAREIGNVTFTGFLPRKIQLAVMTQSDIFVHPAKYPEAFSTAILEAMALGLPVVASKVGGTQESVIDGESGFLTTPSSPVDLAVKISTILNNERFKSRTKTFNRERAKKFDITHVGPKIVKLYEEALT